MGSKEDEYDYLFKGNLDEFIWMMIKSCFLFTF